MTSEIEIKGLITQLKMCVTQVDNQILELRRQAGEMGCRIEQLRTFKGDYILIGLLTAKANALSALAYLMKGETNGDTHHT